MKKLKVSLAHSPDADDRFMFWPLRQGLLNPRLKSGVEIDFYFTEAGTQQLNNLASTGTIDVCAISAAHYLNISENYQPLKMGSSVGNNYGPVLVGLKDTTQQILKKNPAVYQAEVLQQILKQFPILSPGPQTTAHQALLMCANCSEFLEPEYVNINPLSLVFERLVELQKNGRNYLALLIHEGRLTFQQYGCEKIADLGELWKSIYGGSLVLGINVISKKIPLEIRYELSELFQESCKYALNHFDTYANQAQDKKSPFYSPLSTEELRHYLDLYCNQTTIDISETDKISFEKMLRGIQTIKKSNLPLIIDWI